MKLRPIIFTAVLLVLLACTVAFPGCNTWRGAGQDVERAGEKMQGDDDR